MSKVSAGAVELSSIYTVKFMESFLTEARQSDEKWRIIGTDLQIQDDESESREQYKN